MELPNIPQNKDLTYIGYSTYRDQNQLFGIKRKDRRQHVYILGKSGTGKSVLMSNMIMQNILNGEGVCVVDPHGELVEGVLGSIPPHRVKDVVYFNPADVEYQIGFNVLELVDSKYKHLVASGLMGIFTKIWANAWSARMEYILNNCILALLDTPGTTLLGIPRLLVDKDYRQKIIANLKDPVIKSFWIHEYEAWQDKFRNEAIAPIQNKVGQFLSTSVIRNIVGQSNSTVNIFDMMNEGKIFLVNVSKGRIGEDNSKLLGGMIITKIQLAAMERVRIPEEERKDFYLYVDEFQNFVTDSFASILSEARKYRLNLTVAHQYTAQLVTKESSAMRDSIFGNVGTMIVFRVGADDADFLEKEFAPEFVPEDIVNLPNYKIYLKLMINGITSRPFSAKTIPPLVKGGNLDIEEQVIKSSRALFCRPREDIEKEINEWSGMSMGDGQNNSNGGNAMNGGTGEKFATVCSVCGKETTVPFKPEPGRPVYCKDCIVKIKAGEIKPVKSNFKETKFDQTTFYKPLSDLGIEFPSPEGNTNKPNLETKNISKIQPQPQYQNNKQNTNFNSNNSQKDFSRKPSVLGAIKSVFSTNTNKPKVVHTPGMNLGLKDALNKALKEGEIKEIDPSLSLKDTKENLEIKQAPISLSALKPASSNFIPKDRAASGDTMNSLKDLLKEVVEPEVKKVEEIKEEIKKEENKKAEFAEVGLPQTPPEPAIIIQPEIVKISEPEIKEKIEEKVKVEEVPKVEVKKEENKIEAEKVEEIKEEKYTEDIAKKIKEVPEEVLRKILEE